MQNQDRVDPHSTPQRARRAPPAEKSIIMRAHSSGGPCFAQFRGVSIGFSSQRAETDTKNSLILDVCRDRSDPQTPLKLGGLRRPLNKLGALPLDLRPGGSAPLDPRESFSMGLVTNCAPKISPWPVKSKSVVTFFFKNKSVAIGGGTQ